MAEIKKELKVPIEYDLLPGCSFMKLDACACPIHYVEVLHQVSNHVQKFGKDLLALMARLDHKEKLEVNSTIYLCSLKT